MAASQAIDQWLALASRCPLIEFESGVTISHLATRLR
jgi:hypothetical protein